MDKVEITTILKKLKALPHDMWKKEVKQFSVETLEMLARKLYDDYILKKSLYSIYSDDILDIILEERVTKLDDAFEWTKENKEKFSMISKKLTQAFEKAYNEAISVADELENRIKNNDNYLKDYEIIIEITPYIGGVYEEDSFDSFGYVLSEPISSPYSIIHYHFGHSNSEKLDEKPIYLDKTHNWGISHFGNVSDEDNIGYATHNLLHHSTGWSLKDIVNITKIYADVKVYHQYNEEV
jgi:hypothetical protein